MHTSPRPSAAVDPTADPVDRVAAALSAHNIEAVVVATAAGARERVLSLVPEGAEVHWAKSRTLEGLGLPEVFLTGR